MAYPPEQQYSSYPPQQVHPVFYGQNIDPNAQITTPGYNDLYDPAPIAPLPKEGDSVLVATFKFFFGVFIAIIGMAISAIVHLCLLLLQPVFGYVVVIVFALATIPYLIQTLRGEEPKEPEFYHPFTLDIANMMTFFTCDYSSAIGISSQLDSIFQYVFLGSNVTFQQAPMHCLWELVTVDDFPCILPGEENALGECERIKQERKVRKSVDRIVNKGSTPVIDQEWYDENGYLIDQPDADPYDNPELGDVREFQDSIMRAIDKEGITEILEDELSSFFSSHVKGENKEFRQLLTGVHNEDEKYAKEWLITHIKEIVRSSVIREIVVDESKLKEDMAVLVKSNYKKVYELIMEITGKLKKVRDDPLFDRVRAVIFAIRKRLRGSLDIDSKRVRRQLESASMTRYEVGKSLFGTNTQVMDHFVCCHTEWGDEHDWGRSTLYKESAKKCNGWQFTSVNCAYREPIYQEVVDSMENMSSESEIVRDYQKKRNMFTSAGSTLIQTLLSTGSAAIAASYNLPLSTPIVGAVALLWEIFSRIVSWLLGLERGDVTINEVLDEIHHEKRAKEETID